MPKAELHVHLEGTLEPAMLLDLARRNRIPVPYADAADVRRAYAYPGLQAFLDVYFAGCRVLRTRQDFYDLTFAYLRTAAASGVLRAEMMFGPQTFLDAGVPIDDQLGGILSAIADARATWEIDGALIVSAHRHRTQADALELFDLVSSYGEHIVGFGLGSAERDNPPAKFADYFAAARDAGFRTTVHAGEEGPAAYVREALDVCKVDRIDHGVAAADDGDLVRRLADEQVPLTMCPLSNLRLGVVDDLRRHPLKQLKDAGVLVTVNSDDPPYFGGYINDNYAAVTTALQLDADDVYELAANSFRAAFADDGSRLGWQAALDRWKGAA